MKKEIQEKKLLLNKTVIARLDHIDLNSVKAGAEGNEGELEPNDPILKTLNDKVCVSRLFCA